MLDVVVMGVNLHGLGHVAGVDAAESKASKIPHKLYCRSMSKFKSEGLKVSRAQKKKDDDDDEEDEEEEEEEEDEEEDEDKQD